MPCSRFCEWCGDPMPEGARRDAEVCGGVCRKRRWRFRQAVAGQASQIGELGVVDALPGMRRFGYADPPYPGKAFYYHEREEVDHRLLLERLCDGYPDGWALSTSAQALARVLPLCPASTRVCVWLRPIRRVRSRRPLAAWEPLLIHGGRPLLSPGAQAALDVLDCRSRFHSYPGALVGMKPPQFAVWLFTLLGAQPDDELVDLYPGSGAVSRAWAIHASQLATTAARYASAA